MKNSDRELFKQALQEAMEEKHSEALAEVREEITPSARHLRKVSRILGVDVQDTAHKRYPVKRMIAWGLAAVLLMISALTAYASRGTRFGFVERVYEDYTQVSFGFSFDIIRTIDIEERYELDYIPSGYMRTRVYTHRQRVEYIYHNANSDEIEFHQYPLNEKVNWGFRNDFGRMEIKQYGEIYVYCYNCPDSRTFLWRDQKYAMLLFVSTAMDDAEISKIIHSVYVK